MEGFYILGGVLLVFLIGSTCIAIDIYLSWNEEEPKIVIKKPVVKQPSVSSSYNDEEDFALVINYDDE